MKKNIIALTSLAFWHQLAAANRTNAIHKTMK